MDDDGGLLAETELAWAGFRVRLADRLAEFEDDDLLMVEIETGVEADDLDGSAPYLSFVGWGPEDIQAEAVGNHDLDERFHIDEDGEAVLLGADFRRPDDEHETTFHQDVALRDVDGLAVRCVQVLRLVYGVLHPAFLAAEGLESDGAALDEVSHDAVREDETALPTSHDELVGLVDDALEEMTDELRHDSDGDVPFRVGMSVVFVRVCEDRPAVELFAELVSDPARPERLPVELDILNRTHDFAKFHVEGSAVRISYTITAWPFSARQLRTVLHRLLGEVDEIAAALALRVEGRRFLEEPEAEHGDRADTTPRHPGMVALLELLHLGPVSSLSVGALFEHDRLAIIAQLTGIRTGRIDCGEHDTERVLTCLRRGLRHVVDGEVPERRPRRIPPRQSTEQASLVADEELGEDTLDLGWSA